MVLNPLAEVRIGMFMTIVIRCRESMVYFERRREGRQDQQGAGDGPHERETEHTGMNAMDQMRSHKRGASITAIVSLSI